MPKNKFQKSKMPGIKVIKTKLFEDHRGKFKKIFSKELFSPLKKSETFIKEINWSFTEKKGTIRGMHFQYKPFTEDKIITCLKGRIFDVVIDLRTDSKTFLKWKYYILDESVNESLFIPKGFAHGYQSMTNKTEIVYFVSAKYSSKHERSINPLSSMLNINWPINKKIFSEKDKKSPFLDSNFKGLKN